MSEDKLPEPELQKWFKKVTSDHALREHIVGVDELQAWGRKLGEAARATQRTTREGVLKALRVCEVLWDADHLSADLSVAAPGLPQLRPDIVLTSHSGHYVLIELKTMSAPERQAVQELLAYSMSIKMQAPYVNDFMFIIVARHWDTLLVHATRALIMDGKQVLPLHVSETGRSAEDERQFSLRIRQDLFDFNFVQFFDPWHALVPAEIGVYRPRQSSSGVDKYLIRVGWRAMQDAIRLNQTGFVFFWTQRKPGAEVELACATLVTVNQHWRESDHLPSGYIRYSTAHQRGFHGLNGRIAEGSRRPVPQLADDDPWRNSGSGDAAARVYKQSALSYELLERYRNPEEEARLPSRAPGMHYFELNGGYVHLDMFRAEWAGHTMVIRHFQPFGELEDFIRDNAYGVPQSREQLVQLIDWFKDYKDAQPDAVPERVPPELMEPLPPEWQ